MKLTTITQLTLDGVTQGNGGPTVEDLEGGFERGGWARGAGDDTTRDHIAATFQRADAFLFGRRTYDILHEFWGTLEDLKRHPIGVA
jgi:dihydrofolate reductase